MGPNEPDPNDGRMMLGLGGLIFIPLSVGAVYGLAFNVPAPQGPVEWAIHVFLSEVAVTATLFFGIGFAWAISANRTLKRIFDRITVKFAWLFIPIAIPALLTAAWIAIFH